MPLVKQETVKIHFEGGKTSWEIKPSTISEVEGVQYVSLPRTHNAGFNRLVLDDQDDFGEVDKSELKLSSSIGAIRTHFVAAFRSQSPISAG